MTSRVAGNKKGFDKPLRHSVPPPLAGEALRGAPRRREPPLKTFALFMRTFCNKFGSETLALSEASVLLPSLLHKGRCLVWTEGFIYCRCFVILFLAANDKGLHNLLCAIFLRGRCFFENIVYNFRLQGKHF